MIFSDLIFVFAFLPVYLFLVSLCREGWAKNLVAMICSAVFLTWGRSIYYALIFVSAFLIYICGLLTKKSKLFEAAGGIIAALSATVAVIFLGGKDLRSALLSVGFVLFALRSASYLRFAAREHRPERDFLKVGVYLISLENMLIAPLETYKSAEARLGSRKPILSKASYGLCEFIKGFALTAVCGLSFEALRAAAVENESYPWLNAVILIIAVFGEFYTISAGYVSMSRGIACIEGYSPSKSVPAFIPSFRVSGHLSEIFPGFSDFVKDCFGGSTVRAAVSLAIISLMAGTFIGFGAGAAAFFGLLLLLSAVECLSDKKAGIADLIISAAVMLAAFVILACGSAENIAAFLSSFDRGKFDYDITYSLNAALGARMPWLIVGALAVSPLRRAVSAFISERCGSQTEAYGAVKIAETVFCALLLVVATVAGAG